MHGKAAGFTLPLYFCPLCLDTPHQAIIEVQAHGMGSEQELLIPVAKTIQATKTNSPFIAAPTLINKALKESTAIC